MQTVGRLRQMGGVEQPPDSPDAFICQPSARLGAASMRVPRIAAHVFALEWGAETDVAHRVVPANGLNDADHFMLVVSVPVEHEEQRRGIVVDMAKGVEHIRLLGSSYSYVVNRQMNRNQSKMRSRYMSTSWSSVFDAYAGEVEGRAVSDTWMPLHSSIGSLYLWNSWSAFCPHA